MADTKQETVQVLVLHREILKDNSVGVLVAPAGYAGQKVPDGMVSAFGLGRKAAPKPGCIYTVPAANVAMDDKGRIVQLAMGAMLFKCRVQGEIAADYRVLDAMVDAAQQQLAMERKVAREKPLQADVQNLARAYAKLPWNRRSQFMSVVANAIVDAARGQ